MAEAAAEQEIATVPARRRRRRFRPLRWLGLVLLSLIALIVAGLVVIDTDPGHRFLADRIAAMAPRSGLRIRIGRIDGSIWGETRLRDVRLSDPQGLFLEIPELALDWHPTAWAANRLDIDRLATDLAILHRLPKLRSTGERKSILPGFDIRIGALDIRTLRIEPAVTGRRRIGRIAGRGDVRQGRAMIDLSAATSAGDRLRLLLDAAPDADRFDLETRLQAPTGGLVGALAGTKRPMALVVSGDGGWSAWKGKARLDISARRIADLALDVSDGTYALSGILSPAPILQGKLQRLSAPRILVTGAAQLADRRLDSTLSLRSPALSLDLAGVVDLAESAFDGMRINAHLLKPPALFPNMTGRAIDLRTTLEGPFATAAFDYALTADRIQFDDTGFEEVRAQGRGRFSAAPVALPIRLTARRVTGVGAVAGGILANLAIDGTLKVTPRTLTGDGLSLRSDKIAGKLSLLLDLVSGNYTVTLSGGLARYLIPGLGIVDVLTELKVLPGPGGRGTTVAGRGRAWVRRFDNAFLRSLAGGLPMIETGLVRGADGVLALRGLVLTGPTVRIAGNGIRRRDGTFFFEGAGTQGTYGPLKIRLDGDISKPKVDLLLDRPMEALGLAGVSLSLDPTPAGFAYAARGQSTLGPFTSGGAILLPANQPAVVAVAALDVARTRASGQLRSDPGGFTGRLAVAGGGLDGTLDFTPTGPGAAAVQQIGVKLAANGAQFPGPPVIAVRRGTMEGVIRLDPAGTSIKGSISGQGVRRGGLTIARLAATADLTGGSGRVRASIAGSRGRAFDLTTEAVLAPDRVRLVGQGSVDRRPIRLTTPADLTRDGAGWRLAPTRLEFAGGNATLAGRFGSGGATEVDAGLDRMPLAVLDIASPGLGLGGAASGKLSYRLAAGATAPTGRADLIVRGLTRSGLVLSSRPVDVGIAAVLSADAAVARAVVASGGRTIGRAQGRVAPLAAGGDLSDRLAAAPLFAQLRYDGPADILWRLTGVETIDLSGPVAIGADVGGRLGQPLIRGSLRTSGARLESAVTGTVITGLQASGRFDGSRLVIDRYAGATPKGGTVSGRAAFDLAAARGFGMDVTIDAKEAVLLDRDDIGATVTGPLTIRSDGAGGTIAGDVTLEKARYRLGQAAAAAIPRLPATEINRPADEGEVAASPVPWTLDLHAKARNRVAVTGLGLDSEWRADLRIKGTVDNPAITGRADLVRGGYEFAGRRFDLDRGAIRFLGEAPPDPVLDIVAQANIQGLNATIRVSGTGLKPEIDFTSVPALPEDELLSRLLFGTSITNLSAPEALQLAAAVTSLRGGGTGLNPINAVRRAAGLDRLRILPADVTTGQRTSVAAGKYIGRRTYVEVITDGQGYSATRVEFQITRWLSLLSSISTLGRTSANVRVSKDY
ncbi:translocation/assembly module TamB domain-containing protein [Sphingomonas profundi]|uniref:translocation/assembly module TamB domain-containing protein n=1 Tax=Alterirhizorhabdus profundi TaxID=2681549 RepID=UPI0012E7FCBD|nr:translocation/assembly module TamB domain-containing protein [Sphingomonas profundi]